MSDRMTWDEIKREYDRQLDRSVERIMERSRRCETHGTHFVAGVGIGNEFFPFGKDGGCPECFWQAYKKEKENG